MMDTPPLYSRSQAQELTQLDAQTLDYLTRLGALKPVAGGGGKGHHRKYDQHQITLGRMLKEAAEFGLGGNALTMIAAEFQASIEWFTANGLSEHAYAASSLIQYRHEMETQGFVEVSSVTATQPYGTKERIEGGSWDRLVEFHQQIAPLPKGIVAICRKASFTKMRLHYDRFMALRPLGDGKATSGEIHLFKNEIGGWEIDFEVTPEKALSFITIRLRDIKHELWRRS